MDANAASPISLPSLEEQDYIVTNVGPMMSLVDRLETQLAQSREKAEKLLDALVAELTGGAGYDNMPADDKPANTHRRRKAVAK